MDKITDKNFIDWYHYLFPYGYGTGDEYYVKAVKEFFSNLEEDGRMYQYEKLEKAMGAAECWFIINMFANDDVEIIEYGTSPRYAWIEPRGELIRDYLRDKTENDLYELVANYPEDYYFCGKDYCSCDQPCENPLFVQK